MIGRRIMGVKTVGEYTPSYDLSTGKTIVIGCRSNTSACSYRLRILYNGVAYSLQELVLAGIIEPAVLMYECATSLTLVPFSLFLSLYEGEQTSTRAYPDWTVMFCVKPDILPSIGGIELYSAVGLISGDRGLEAYLFDGAFECMRGTTISDIDVLNCTENAYKLGNIASETQFSFGYSPYPLAPTYTLSAGNAELRGAPENEYPISSNGQHLLTPAGKEALHVGRPDIFGVYWLNGVGDFLFPVTDCHKYSTNYPVWRLNVQAATKQYLFNLP